MDRQLSLPKKEKTMFPLSQDQIQNILNKLVPLIAAEEDHEYFRGVLGISLEGMNSVQAALFVQKLLKV